MASDELTVKLVDTSDITSVRTLRDHGRPTKHLAFDSKGSLLTLSCTDGVVYIYSLTSEQPELIQKVDGIIGRLETDSETSAQIAWHPDGRAFALNTHQGHPGRLEERLGEAAFVLGPRGGYHRTGLVSEWRPACVGCRG